MIGPSGVGGDRSAELAEELADVGDQQVGGVVGGPVAAAVELAPGGDVVVIAFGEAAQWAEVVGERGQADREGRRLGRLLLVRVLVVEAGRGGGGVGEPVDGGVGEDQIGVGDTGEELADPGELAGGRVGERVGEGLRLGLLGAVPACTDLTTKPWVQEAGVEVLDQPFFAEGNVATAGGCLASPYLAAWLIGRSEGLEAASSALHYVAPVGEKDSYVARALAAVTPYLPATTAIG